MSHIISQEHYKISAENNQSALSARSGRNFVPIRIFDLIWTTIFGENSVGIKRIISAFSNQDYCVLRQKIIHSTEGKKNLPLRLGFMGLLSPASREAS